MIGDAGLLKVAARFVGVLAATVGVMDFAALADGLGPPDRGVADRRAHFEDGPGVDQARVLVEEAADRRADDGNLALLRLPLHLLQDRLALGEHGVKIIFDAFIGDWHLVLFPLSSASGPASSPALPGRLRPAAS